jgi:hypothetical protein
MSTSVVFPTLLYIHSKAVIPAKAGIQLRKTGFRVKPGMTIEVKRLMEHYTRSKPLNRAVLDTDSKMRA